MWVGRVTSTPPVNSERYWAGSVGVLLSGSDLDYVRVQCMFTVSERVQVCVRVCVGGGVSSVPRCQELEEAKAHGDTDNH